jgi:hypothetical protein
MSKSTFLVVCLSIAVGYILATGLNRPSAAGQPPAPEAVAQEGQVWRFQLSQPSDSSCLFLTDTVTGKVLARLINTDREWQAYVSPTPVQPARVRR